MPPASRCAGLPLNRVSLSPGGGRGAFRSVATLVAWDTIPAGPDSSLPVGCWTPAPGKAIPPRRMVTLADVQAARERIRALVSFTPCPIADNFTEVCGAQVHFKLEMLQRTE